MATLKDKSEEIKALNDYVSGSLKVKSSDDSGTVLKWLKDKGDGTADRQEKFFATDTEQADIPYEERTVTNEIVVNDPQ